ncbi:LPXTG cell wall anchor domain-containing protein [Demequina aurantiaca]|uniref:LPXTG cell wall anchor domain-containing protein n=1 Tax=Demequina aurantiaca TaxID=676200 RepID=UPI0034E2AF3B
MSATPPGLPSHLSGTGVEESTIWMGLAGLGTALIGGVLVMVAKRRRTATR